MKKIKDREKLVVQIKNIRQRLSKPLIRKDIKELDREVSIIEKKLGIKH